MADPRFDDVVGQERAAAALAAEIRRSGGAGSTLLVGPEGVGRFLLALRAARAILAGDDERAAHRVDSLVHPDLHVLEPDAGIRAIRDEAIPKLGRRPAEAERAVLIVRDLDRFHRDAHHTLLKTLEEPPAGAAIFVVAEAADGLPETIVSRCRLLRLRSLSTEETAEVLRRHGAPPEAAGDAEGSPGRALYQLRNGVPEAVDRLLPLLRERARDPLAEAARLASKRKDEEGPDHRRRVREVLLVAGARLRKELPQTEEVLREVVEALGSLERNANPGILLADLVLHPWKKSAT